MSKDTKTEKELKQFRAREEMCIHILTTINKNKESKEEPGYKYTKKDIEFVLSKLLHRSIERD